MPRLLIELPDGQPTRRRLARRRPLTVGSDPRCDVSLADDPYVAPVQCRIVWDGRVCRLRAHPEAGGVRVNGNPTTSCNLYEGDEIAVGEAVMRLEAESGEDLPLPGSLTSGMAPDLVDTVSDDWGDAEDEPPSEEIEERESRRGSRQSKTEPVPPTPRSIWASPLVIGLGVGLAIVGIVALVLYTSLRRRSIEMEYQAAVQDMQQLSYTKAIKRFDVFLEEHGTAWQSPKARYFTALCRVLRQTDTAQPRWEYALDEMQRLVEQLRGGLVFRRNLDDVAQLMGDIAVGLATDALRHVDPEMLEKARAAQRLLENTVHRTKRPKDKLRKLAETIAATEAAILKARTRAAAIADMAAAREAGESLLGYRIRGRLLRRYPDLAGDPDVISQVRLYEKLNAGQVRFDTLIRPVRRREAEQSILKTTTLSTFVTTPGEAGPGGGIALLMAGSNCYGIDVGTGSVAWRQGIGFDSPFFPVAFRDGGRERLLVADSRHDELLLLEQATGQAVWRQPIGEPFVSRPCIHPRWIFLVTERGTLLMLDRKTGVRRGEIHFGQPISVSPVADGSGRYLYVLGQAYTLFVVDLQQQTCAEALYVGHRNGSVTAPLLRIGRYVFVCDNRTLDSSQLTVLLAGEDGSTVVWKENLPLAGQVHEAPVSYGSGVLYVATDRRAMVAFSINPYDAKDPLSQVADLAPVAGPRASPYLWCEAETKVWMAATRLNAYRLEPQHKKLEELANLNQPGGLAQPLRGRAGAVFVARHRKDVPGVLFEAVDIANHQSRWQVGLGAGWWAVSEPEADGKHVWTMTSAGRSFAVPVDEVIHKTPAPEGQDTERRIIHTLKPDGVTPLPVLPSGRWVSIGKERVYYPGPGLERLRVRDTRPGSLEGAWRWMALPGPAATAPILFGDGLLIPSTDGRIYWIAPTSGVELADPFEAEVHLDEPMRWPGVAVVSESRILAANDRGILYLLELRAEPLRYFAARTSLPLKDPIRSPIALVGRVAFFVDTANRLHGVDTDTLEPRSMRQLDGPVTAGPFSVGNAVVLCIADRTMLCLEPGLEAPIRWELPLDGSRLSGPPLIGETQMTLTQRNGDIRTVNLADGREIWKLSTHVPLMTGPMPCAGHLLLLDQDGNMHAVEVPGSSGATSADTQPSGESG